MTPARLARGFAILALTLWLTKAVTIWFAGGLDKSPAEAPLFLAALACYLVAWGAIGVTLVRALPAWLRAIAAFLGAVAGDLLLYGSHVAFGPLRGDDRHWAWGESNLWVVGVVTIVVTAALAHETTTVDRQLPDATEIQS